MKTQTSSISFASLPALGAALEDGTFAGLTTRKDGTHCAVVRLPDQGSDLPWKEAVADAKKRGGELPTKIVAALVTTNLKVDRGVYWTCEEYDASCAWYFHSDGGTNTYLKSAAFSALAVRLIPLTA